MRSGQRAPPYRPWRPNPAGVGELGLAVASQEALVFLSASRMFHFAAPEVASGASPARDYRSFGMIVLEPLTGSHPFAGLSEAVITAQLTTRAAGTSVVEDPRWRNLCRWLLVRDPATAGVQTRSLRGSAAPTRRCTTTAGPRRRPPRPPTARVEDRILHPPDDIEQTLRHPVTPAVVDDVVGDHDPDQTAVRRAAQTIHDAP